MESPEHDAESSGSVPRHSAETCLCPPETLQADLLAKPDYHSQTPCGGLATKVLTAETLLHLLLTCDLQAPLLDASCTHQDVCVLPYVLLYVQVHLLHAYLQHHTSAMWADRRLTAVKRIHFGVVIAVKIAGCSAVGHLWPSGPISASLLVETCLRCAGTCPGCSAVGSSQPSGLVPAGSTLPASAAGCGC